MSLRLRARKQQWCRPGPSESCGSLISMPRSPIPALGGVGEREAHAAELELLAPRAHVGRKRQRDLDEAFGRLARGGRETNFAAVEADRAAVCAAHPQKLGPA